MRSIAIATLSVALSATATAQETNSNEPAPVNRKSELGLMGETSFGNNNNGNIDGMAGIQYKRWVKPNAGYRIIAAYGRYSNFGTPKVLSKEGDTVTETHRRTEIPVAIVGGGLEMQRHFYKRIYLYAAAELRVGYGRGSYDSIVIKRNDNSNYANAISGVRMNSVSLFSIAAAPSIGAKFIFNRIVFGTELSALNLNFSSLKYPNTSSSGVGEFNPGTFWPRFFVHYPF